MTTRHIGRAAVGEHTGCGEPAVVDMGAYEHQDGTAFETRVGDIDGNGVDGDVLIADLLLLLLNWG